MTAAAAPAHTADTGTRWALLLGNFAIGCGVMVVPGALNDLARDLAVPVALAGQLVTVAAWAMALAAPVLAALLTAAVWLVLATTLSLWLVRRGPERLAAN